MSGQPERCYAVEELKSLQSSIADLTQSMVIQRARVEKYKDTDLAAAGTISPCCKPSGASWPRPSERPASF